MFTGPESSGKTYLSNLLSKKYNFTLVEEYARIFLNDLNRPYTFKDLKEIERGQQEIENVVGYSDIIIQDTDFLTIWVWYQVKYNHHPERVYNYLQRHLPDFYFLCAPDIAWEYDHQRENEHDRDMLYDIYLSEIEKLKVPYVVVNGSFSERESICTRVIQELL